jgi:hypothetical protein
LYAGNSTTQTTFVDLGELDRALDAVLGSDGHEQPQRVRTATVDQDDRTAANSRLGHDESSCNSIRDDFASHALAPGVRSPNMNQSSVSSHPLVICVGKNTTATAWLVNELFGILHEPSAHGASFLTRRTMHTSGIDGKPLDNAGKIRYRKLHSTLMALTASERSTFNFQQFDEMGAISLVAMRHLLPWVLLAYPNARVVLSTDAAVANDVSQPLEREITVHVDNMVVRCLTPPAQLLEIDIRENGATDARERLHRFVSDLLPC